jgi:hypothetical protein
MRSHVQVSAVLTSLLIGATPSGCFSSTKEVDTIHAAVGQVPAPPVVQVQPPLIVPPADVSKQTTTTDNGAVVQKKTTTTDNGTEKTQNTTTWRSGDLPTETTTTISTSTTAQ